MNSEVFLQLRRQVVGIDSEVPLATGGALPYLFLDNAASTPTFRPVLEKVNLLMEWYSSIHRGTGYKSSVSTEMFEEARWMLLKFVGGDEDRHRVIFNVNTTGAINRLACSLPLSDDAVILLSPMEHHSNDLPWRRRGGIEYLTLDETGRIDLAAAERQIASLKGRLALLALTGASNISGRLTPIHELARLAHSVGALVAVDAAQLGPHCAIEIDGSAPGEHLDFIALAGHKMYAPFGGAALIGRTEALARCRPACVGGGTVNRVTRDDVVWAGAPALFEPGTPNTVGAVAMAAAAEILDSIGFDAIREHEIELTHRLLAGLRAVPGLKIYSTVDLDDLDDQLGVIVFNLEGYNHGCLAAILSYEYGIGVRNGSFCAQPYAAELLAAGNGSAASLDNAAGMVRVSLGVYNNAEDVDRFLQALRNVATYGSRLDYSTDEFGVCHPVGYSFPLPEFIKYPVDAKVSGCGNR